MHRVPSKIWCSSVLTCSRVCRVGDAGTNGALPLFRPPFTGLLISRHRELHTAVLARGLGEAFIALPGAGKDKQGHITVPVPDPKLELLAELERTQPVHANIEMVEVEKELFDELVSVVGDVLAAVDEPAELSGKFLAALRSSDAIVIAVPCNNEAGDPVAWIHAAERVMISADLHGLEQQVCKGGNSGPDAVLDDAKLRKALTNAKDPLVRRDAEELVRDVLSPGFTSLRARLRAGVPAREARPGLAVQDRVPQFDVLDTRFEELARGWLNLLVTWRPLLILADVPESAAGRAANTDSTDVAEGNEFSHRLAVHAKSRGVPCLTACVALESESAALKDEPDFLKEYLESFGLRLETDLTDSSSSLRPWRSQSATIVRRIPSLLNLLTYYTAGEKEARAWMCSRVRKDHSPLPFALIDSAKAVSAPAAKVGKPTKGASDEGVPAFLAARAIHTSFENRVKNVLVWKFDDLEAIGTSDAGPRAKEKARSAGKMKKLSAQSALEDGDVVEFDLN